ncbi:DNA translocase FtsK [Taibaiella lutea]|uniref:DNA translocase FtsK n=1 Tax=Taibaiella lutea TaxID=2608001 RepID=A0A5M6CL16_9BACT|nr:DNA translocase FtsK [Taibaiella lutea]KAA5535120.1 DNA translocase FtsK [Taibaiella lutea]
MSLSNWIKKQIANLNEKVNPPQPNVYVETIREASQEEFSLEVEQIQEELETDIEAFNDDFLLENYQSPTLDLLEELNPLVINRDKLEEQKNTIIIGLRGFGIEISSIIATVGPTVTTFEITISGIGKRVEQVVKLSDDIASLLYKSRISIYSRPENGTIALEVSNNVNHIVGIRESISHPSFVESTMQLPLALGRTLYNEPLVIDLASINHLLIAGSTGQGKSSLLDSIILSLLYKKHPSQVKLILISTNRISFSVYKRLEKHFLASNPSNKGAIIVNKDGALESLYGLCEEMENRYELLSLAQVRNHSDYNKKFLSKELIPTKEFPFKFLPTLVLIIDELAEITQFGKDGENLLIKLAQKSRSVGIHLIISTQRASDRIITNAIKENFTTRIGFRVPAKSDSNILLDNDLASKIGRIGEAIYQSHNQNIKIQCSYTTVNEIERVVEFIGKQDGYSSAFELPGYEDYGIEKEAVDLSKRDKMFEDCAKMVVNSQSGSTSMLQRKFNLGYNRADRIMLQLEAAGIVGSASGSKPRDVLITTEYELARHLEELF